MDTRITVLGVLKKGPRTCQHRTKRRDPPGDQRAARRGERSDPGPGLLRHPGRRRPAGPASPPSRRSPAPTTKRPLVQVFDATIRRTIDAPLGGRGFIDLTSGALPAHRADKWTQVFRVKRCAASRKEHRMDPKSGVHFWVRCSHRADKWTGFALNDAPLQTKNFGDPNSGFHFGSDASRAVILRSAKARLTSALLAPTLPPMFLTFFTELRAAKIPVTLREYLTLRGARPGSRRPAVEDFYYLRARRS